jgi:rhomboid protease GluP
LWSATAEGAAGEEAKMRSMLEPALAEADPLTRRGVESRLARPLASPGSALTPESRAILADLEHRLDQHERFGEGTGFARRRPVVTAALAAVNLLAFGLELACGDSTDVRTLVELGAFVPAGFSPAQAWRLVAFLFLHFGWLHLGLNLLGILVVGPYLEYAVGRARYLAVYFLSGIAGGLVILAGLSLRPPTHVQMIVGASGCLMGLLGGTAAVLLRGWRRERAHEAWRRLAAIVFLVTLQTCFDLVTPQVSLTAHLTGFVVGFAVTGLMSHRVSRPR